MIHSWFVLALFGAFMQAVGLALKKHAIRESGANGLVAACIFVGAGVILAITHVIVSGHVWYPDVIEARFWGGVAIAVAFGTLGVLFSYRSLDLGDLSAVSPYSVLGTVLYFIPAYLFLREVPTTSDVYGMLVIIFGVLVLEGALVPGKKRKETEGGATYRARHRKALAYFFFAMIFYSFSPTGEKIAITATEPLFASSVIHLGIGIAFLVSILVRPKYRGTGLAADAFRSRGFMLAVGIAAFVAAYGNLSTHFALSGADVATVMSLKRTMPIFSFLIGVTVFRERRNLGRKLVGTLIMIAGAVLIGLSG